MGSGREGGTEKFGGEGGGGEACGLEKTQVIRDLINGDYSSIVVDLPNLGVQFIFILIELCFLCTGLFGLEIYRNTFFSLRYQPQDSMV